MWNWTKMGARVVITPGDVTRVSFSHPLLATLRIPAQPTAADQPKADTGAGANIDRTADEILSSVPQTRTADAGNRLPRTGPSAEPAKLEPDKSGEKPSEALKSAAPPSVAVPEPNNERIRPVDVMKAAIAKADPALTSKRAGQIAMFVSRKDSKLYVRQNFAPLFELPVAISPDERPLGTHIFTAQVDKNDANVLHWSVVSLPAPTRYAVRPVDELRGLRRRKITGAPPVEAKRSPDQDNPTEALDRVKLPADVLARITEALSTGASVIVSDQGITAGETGEGTDFIVKLR
jgi:hypothetical protein